MRSVKTLALVGLGCFMAIIVGELAVRAIDWPCPGPYVDGHLSEQRLPGSRGGGYRPGRGHLRHYEYVVAWDVNADGFRERQLTAKRPGEWRIGLLGDSFLVGNGVERSERFADVWATIALGANQRVSTWNFGAGMCGTAQQAEIAAAFGKRYEIDEFVIVFYGGNDLQDNRQWRPELGDSTPRLTLGRRLRFWLRENVRLSSFLWVHGVRSFYYLTKPADTFEAAHFDRDWPITAVALESFRTACGPRPLTVWYVPSASEWDDAVWSKLAADTGIASSLRYLIRDHVCAWSKRQAVRFVDLGEFLASLDARTALYRIDGHWRPFVHRRIGVELARMAGAALTKNELRPRGAAE